MDRPDLGGRRQILAVHARKVDIGGDVDLAKVASLTAGFTGADLANLVNEAAVIATRRDAGAVDMDDFVARIERIVAGLEKKNRLLNPHERAVVAHHEAGHALVALSLPSTDKVQKVSIIPRGIGTLGYIIQRPTEDRFLMTAAELENKMAVLLGGRASESLIFGEVSTGAADDLAEATDIARNMVARYGMGEGLGHMTYDTDPTPLLGGPAAQQWWQQRVYSEETAREIDCAVRGMVDRAFDRGRAVLDTHRALLERVAAALLAKETLTEEGFGALVAGVLKDEGARGVLMKGKDPITPTLVPALPLRQAQGEALMLSLSKYEGRRDLVRNLVPEEIRSSHND